MEGRILLSDFGGHPFTYELADALARRGVDIEYSYCATNLSPKADFAGDVMVHPLGSGSSFEKYRPLKRLIAELRFGWSLARLVRQTRPSEHVMCNMPVFSGSLCWLLTLDRRPRLVLWLQDIQSGLAAGSPSIVRRCLSAVETFLLRRSDRVIAISDHLADEAIRRGVPPPRLSVLENWAPVERFPSDVERRDEILPGVRVQRPLFMYSGTLARKHDPSMILDLSFELAESGGQMVVISEGEGVEWLRAEVRRLPAPVPLTLLPYQPFESLPDVLASADVLVVLLERDAARSSVPSKTLSYMCAGRAILASMPLENRAAELVSHVAMAGLVAPPEDRDLFLSLGRRLADDPDLRRSLGAGGRRYAELNYNEENAVLGFLSALRPVGVPALDAASLGRF